MEGSPIKLTKEEEELAINFDEAMNAKDYEQALSHVSELIKLRKHNPVYHLWLGDCYRVSTQVDNALDSYRRALDLDGKYYIVGDDFREDVKKHINGLELIQKTTQACGAVKYTLRTLCVNLLPLVAVSPLYQVTSIPTLSRPFAVIITSAKLTVVIQTIIVELVFVEITSQFNSPATTANSDSKSSSM